MKKEWQKNVNFFKKLIQESEEIYICMKDVINESIKNKGKYNSFDDININYDNEISNYLMSFASLVESNSFGIWNNKGKCIGYNKFLFILYFI